MPHFVFLTGKLAEPALRRTLADLAPRAGFEFSVVVLPITVVALATTPWIARHFTLPANVDRLIVPGLCNGELDALEPICGNVPIVRGPGDLRDLPDFFGARAASDQEYGRYDIEILCEINHAPRLTLDDIRATARKARADGADVIDLGCDPGTRWNAVGEVVRALREDEQRVSIDTFDTWEARQAADAGAELILSVNATNREVAVDWGCEVVVVPDLAGSIPPLDALAETVDYLQRRGVRFRIDPVLEPIAFGFAASLGRYLEVRKRYPEVEMMMGVGNLTELTDADSAGINVLLLGICQELGIRSVLTTEVINWSRSSVRELDLARRLVHHACTQHTLPKRVEPNLILLRDPKLRVHGEETLRELAAAVTDGNFRVFAERGELHIMNRDIWLRGTDPFDLFAQMQQHARIDPAHAFYLGYELAKALTALTLGKNYTQDQALRWGFLTLPEKGRHA